MKLLQKNIVLIFLLLAVGIMAQERDRRTDLHLRCNINFCVSSTGQLWLSNSCGEAYTADGIHSTWRSIGGTEEYDFVSGTYECMAAFGNKTALLAGFLHGREDYDYVLRTTSGGLWWDTVVIDPRLDWVHSCCFQPNGRIWLGSASGRSDGVLAYSADTGRTFQVLRIEFGGTSGINTLHMFNADSGYMGGFYNNLFSTSDNWRSVHRMLTPMDQGLLVEYDYQDTWINRIRQWGNYLIVTESDDVFYTILSDSVVWHRTPLRLYSYEVDNQNGVLWAVCDSGRVARLSDWNHVDFFDVSANEIFGIVDGCAYCANPVGVLRVSPDGKVDICQFYTTEHPIEEPPITLGHGRLMWGADEASIYILDEKGWYRVAQPRGILILNPHPDREDCVLFLCEDGKTYSVDTTGNIEPYIYKQPLGDFVKQGVKEVEITTFASGCFHYEAHTVRYSNHDGLLTESYNNIEQTSHQKRQLPTHILEQALLRLGERYSLFPTPQDFGLSDSIDLHAVYENNDYFCTSILGYKLTFINTLGDTLFFYGDVSEDNDFGYKTHYPWLLPMLVHTPQTFFTTYQPCLWQTLRQLMPDTMMLCEHLDNSALRPLISLQSGDLLFLYGDDDDMEEAITASTGKYTHVAMVERDSAGHIWTIEAVPDSGVQRKPINALYDMRADLYRLTIPYDTAAVLARAHSFLGLPYDDYFMPDNGRFYCSELIYECFLNADGKHLFEAKPMNWRDSKGRLPKYWRRHFRKLHVAVPEGVLGTNPSDLSKSPLLRKM
ncbi:MAG: hypothetical protein K6D59_02465 [Bacteroidales bacterium]|nr:hypothetical protein [Bacteroidales bacterium]